MRSRASVPIAENISAYRVTWDGFILANAFVILLYLQKYESVSIRKAKTLARGPLPNPPPSLAAGRRCRREAGGERRLVNNQPVEPNILDHVPKLLEIHWLLNVAVRSKSIALDQIALLF